MPEARFATYLPRFRRDIQEAVARSEERFGALAADRYGQLIRQALLDILENPERLGVKTRPDLAPHAFIYHLTSAANGDRVAGESSSSLSAFRYAGSTVEFARLLHESRDLARHVPLEQMSEHLNED